MNILTICVRGCLESLGSTFNGECVATSKAAISSLIRWSTA